MKRLFCKKTGSTGHAARLMLTLAVMAGFAGAVGAGVGMVAPGPLAAGKTVIVAHGERAAAIAGQLADAGAVYAGPLFHIAARLVAPGHLMAGEYDIPAHASPLDIARMMRDGKSVVRLFTVAEGLTSAEVVALLNKDAALTGDVAAIPPDGSLLPETYRYDFGDTRASLIARMQKGMREKLAALWAARDGDVPLASPQQAVILASVVEKETARPEERPRIAGVFYNRLRIGMRLQSDPTVIYALTHGAGDLGRALTHGDLAVNSPYNTYVADGLPPGPICNPGAASLLAVLHPEHNDYLYFVADGSGGHAFAASLKAQDDNINHWHAATESKATGKRK
ncbi:MAG: endolytic transglycosylase MltG [Alphaproteobacteria bacterium]|nr:endolytic transglycosylase MltG [Alphaproteobacteria bacterium]